MSGSLTQSYFIFDSAGHKVGRKIFYDFDHEAQRLAVPKVEKHITFKNVGSDDENTSEYGGSDSK